ncbi:hypothetical protein [Kallotenue papyrolyticum]|uniref:hypothetical protein n=1 Tax=Kallotenue papyrolyticum TaxID=1325125 RepID=UPI0004929C3F|nr:hypothetical protein [Kallotenue papyrolyticum]
MKGKLVKTPFRGGMLILTHQELVLGEGLLGARNIRRFPLRHLARLELRPSPSEAVLGRSVCLRFVWIDGQITDVDGVGPLAGERIRMLLARLYRVAQ